MYIVCVTDQKNMNYITDQKNMNYKEDMGVHWMSHLPEEHEL